MARSTTSTLLPLDRYAQIMGLSLIHFNNLRDNDRQAAANAYWSQVTHDELAVYIAQAEARLRDGYANKLGLGFDVAPAAHADRIMFSGMWEDWRTELLATPYLHLQAAGSWVWTLVEADAAVSSVSDLVTITTTVPDGTQPDEVQVFYRTTDGADAAGDQGWRIRPLKVAVSGSTATITGHTAQFVKPAVLESATPGDYADAASFVAAVDIYRRVVDDELPVTLVWDIYTQTGAGDPTADLTQTGTIRLVDSERGDFQARPATYADGTHTIAAPTYVDDPDSLTLDYIAGYPYADANQERIDPQVETAVVRLANVLSPDFNHWLNDLAQIKWRHDRNMPDQDNPLQPGEEDCPFGLTNGARFAWSVVRSLRVDRMDL